MKTLRSVVTVLAVTLAMGANSLMADQPHMRHALESLRAARAELAMAEHNKGGWRVRAIGAVDRAIHETEAGMAAGR